MKLKQLSIIIIVFALLSSISVGWASVNTDTPTLPQQEAPPPLPELYEQVSQSVVAISVRDFDDEFSSFFPTGGIGSGFVVDTEGHIVTNNHVIEGADSVDISFYDGTLARAEVIGTDPDSDLAVIKVIDVDPAILQPIELGDSDAVRVGEDVLALGNPFGQNWTMTRGIVSAVGRSNRAQTGFSIAKMIQTDAAMNPGNSGGPLLDRLGRVVGVNTLIFSEDRSSSGVGFAVPVNTVKRVLPDLIANGFYEYTWIGISGSDLNLDLVELLELESATRGVLISRISDDGPAEAAGLEGSNRVETYNGINYEVGGDIIIEVDGTAIPGITELIAYLADNTVPGDQVTVTVIRNGKFLDVPVVLEARPDLAQ